MSAESCGYLSQSLDREQWLLPQVASMKGAMRSATVVWLCIQYLLWSVGVYGFVLWLPTIIQKGAARGIGITGLLSAAPYLFAIICMLLVAHFSDRSLHRKRFVWPFLLCRSCSAWFVSDGGPKLLVGIYFSDPGRQRHVYALWPFLRDHAGDSAEECGGRSNGLG